MGGECVATGLSIGYTFNGPLQNCRQLSGICLVRLATAATNYKIGSNPKKSDESF
jgi:hypothetical protein